MKLAILTERCPLAPNVPKSIAGLVIFAAQLQFVVIAKECYGQNRLARRQTLNSVADAIRAEFLTASGHAGQIRCE
jgi:hypothetical protein